MRTYLILPVLALAVACSRNDPQAAGSAPGPGRGGPPPAAGVGIVTLQDKPLEEASEFIATVRSLNSTTIQPQVEGVVRQIMVRSGDGRV